MEKSEFIWAPDIAVINQSTKVTDAEVQTVMDALQIQVSRDFRHHWGHDCALHFYAKGTPIPAEFWQLVFLDNSDQAGILGYHDVSKTGMPLGEVFVASDLQYGTSWSVTASHELLEMLADPGIATCIQNPNNGNFYALEVGDAVEDDSFGYEINGITVSDFVTPAWFETFHPKGTLYDFQNKVTEPFQLLPGGYIGMWPANGVGGWTQITAENKPNFKASGQPGSRRERRARRLFNKNTSAI